MKKLSVILLLILVLMVGCQAEEPEETIVEVIRNVRVMTLIEDNHQYYESYIGHVSSTGLLKKSFEVDGKLSDVFVSIGDNVKTGDVLASLDKEGLQYALDASQSELTAAKAQYSKAVEGLGYAKNLYNRTLGLYNEGVSSQFDMDQATLNYRISEDDVNSARAIRNQAETNVQAKTYLLNNSDMIAEKDGVILDILSEVGELTGAGYPVILLRDVHNEIIFGVSSKDLDFVEIGMEVKIIVDDKRYVGEMINVNQIPDQTTQTYEVSVKFDETAAIGQVVKVLLPTKTVKGIKLPLGAIRSDGEDYVYINDDGQALRINIEVVGIYNQEVVVKGLPDNTELIVEGIMNLVSGDKVKVVD